MRVQARYLLGTGLLLVAGGSCWMATIQPDSHLDGAAPGFIVAGVGIGMVNPVLASSAVSVVPPERSGMASGANNTFRQVGIATGIAGLGAVFQSQIVGAHHRRVGKSVYGAQIIHRGGAQLQAAMAGGGVRQAAASLPASVRQRAAGRLPLRLLHHLEPSDGDRSGGGLRGSVGGVRPRPPEVTSSCRTAPPAGLRPKTRRPGPQAMSSRP